MAELFQTTTLSLRGLQLLGMGDWCYKETASLSQYKGHLLNLSEVGSPPETGTCPCSHHHCSAGQGPKLQVGQVNLSCENGWGCFCLG